MKKIVTAVLLICCPPAFTHPHIFLTSRSEVEIGGRNINKIILTWTFDRIYSRTLIREFDKNRNGFFDNSEIEFMEYEAFSNLREYNYMCVMIIDGKNFPVKKALSFTPSITAKNMVRYTFSIPVGKNLKTSGSFSIIIYDRTFFCDFKPVGNPPVTVRGPGNLIFSITRKKSRKHFNGYISPDMFTVNYRFNK